MTVPSPLIAQTEQMIRAALAGDSSGHDWWHVDRVRRVALEIARCEGADLKVVELAALLHDIADWKFHGGDDSIGPRTARRWLESNKVAPAIVDHVGDIIATVSFKGAEVDTTMSTLEGRCVQDADRLDAMGAIGVARAFAFGGRFGRPLYDPEVVPERHRSFDEYKNSRGGTLQHFDEKLLLLKDRMQTATGRQLAIPRHAFLEQFRQQFLDEWNAFGDADQHAHPCNPGDPGV